MGPAPGGGGGDECLQQLLSESAETMFPKNKNEYLIMRYGHVHNWQLISNQN